MPMMIEPWRDQRTWSSFCYAVLGSALCCLTSGSRAADNSQCLMCHSAKGLTGENASGQQIPVYVDRAQFAGSAHGRFRCVQCHADLNTGKLPHAKTAKPVDCTRCHYAGNPVGAPEVTPMKQYRDSIHGQAALEQGVKEAPRCKDCHGTHDVRKPTDPASAVARANIPRTCARCHSDQKLVDKFRLPKGQALKYFERSIHGRALRKEGLTVAAVCTDCHGVHNIQPGSVASSTVAREHIPGTCGKCHQGILNQFLKSVHGEAVEQGLKEAPVCTDCHGEHTIRSVQDPTSSVYPTHVAQTCSRCHENARIQQTYGLPANRMASFIGSYHGVASRFGDTTVANCGTCHGAHDILPSSDPRSSINPRNIPATCGKCHPGASENFARGKVHVTGQRESSPGVFYVRWFYIIFISMLMLSFGSYIVLDLVSRWKRRRALP